LVKAIRFVLPSWRSVSRRSILATDTREAIRTMPMAMDASAKRNDRSLTLKPHREPLTSRDFQNSNRRSRIMPRIADAKDRKLNARRFRGNALLPGAKNNATMRSFAVPRFPPGASTLN